MNNSAPLLGLCEVRKSFGPAEVLRDLSLTLNAGEIIGFLGRNGSGKTTTMRIILNLLHKDHGQIYFQGKDTAHDPGYLKKIGYVPQSGGLLDDLSLRENLRCFAALYGLSPQKFAEKLAYYLSEFKMGHLAHARLKTFSKGMKQKVNIIRALIHEPVFLLLDEPLTGLDPWEQDNAIRVLQAFYGTGGKTIFFSSHILADIQKLATRVLLLDHGRIEREFTPEENVSEQIKALFV